MTSLKSELDAFAKKLIAKASQDATALPESTDAFKAVATYYVADKKNRKKSGDDEEPDDSGFSFADEVVNGGSSKVPARRNS